MSSTAPSSIARATEAADIPSQQRQHGIPSGGTTSGPRKRLGTPTPKSEETHMSGKHPHPAQDLVREHSDVVGRRIAERAVTELKGMKAERLSGDDSGLESVWQEYCVQIRGEQSIFWDAYQDTVRDVIRRGLSDLPKTELAMLWLCTEQGWDWAFDVVDSTDPVPPPHPGIDEVDVADWIMSTFVDVLADQDDDPAIERCLFGGEGESDDDEDFDDEDLDGEGLDGEGRSAPES
jgi:hypothetical protein